MVMGKLIATTTMVMVKAVAMVTHAALMAHQAIAVLKIMPVMMSDATTAGAFIVTTNHATTTSNVALKSKFLARKDAAECALNTMRSHAAVMFLSTILKQSAAKSQNTMTLKNAKPANAGFANVNANMFHNTIGSMFAVKTAATLPAHAKQSSGCTVQITLI